MCVHRIFLGVLSILVCLFVLAEATLSEEANKPTEAKFNEIGDVAIITDSATITKEAESLQKEISEKPFVRDRALDFNKIRPVRSKLSKRSLELRALLENFRQYRTSLRTQLQQKEAAAQAVNDTDVDAINIGIERLKREIDVMKSALAQLRMQASEESEPSKKTTLENQAKLLETEIQSKEIVQLRALERQKSVLTNATSVTQQDIDRLKVTIDQIDGIYDEGQSKLRRLDETLVSLDELSASLLQTDILNINYTDRSTYIFGALVGAVIIGFFAIALLSEEVRKAIFAGDSGIQFVTLFSLVIAIILFGVLKILEGKELAALLGGLSGYILGRGSNGRQQRQQQGQQDPSGLRSRGSAEKSVQTQSGAPSAAGSAAITFVVPFLTPPPPP